MTRHDFWTHIGVALATFLVVAPYSFWRLGLNLYTAIFIVGPLAIVLVALLGRSLATAGRLPEEPTPLPASERDRAAPAV